MVNQFLKAPILLIVTVLLLAVLFGPLAAAIEPLFEVFAQSEGVQDPSTPFDAGYFDTLLSVLFVQGPLVLIAMSILFVVLVALKFEGATR
jgi:hypothetical protein